MYRGTTPTIVFKIKNSKINLGEMKQIYVTFKSNVREITYDKEDIELDVENNKIVVHMTQEDTLYFHSDLVNVQIRLLSRTDKAYATSIKQIKLNGILKEGVIDE